MTKLAKTTCKISEKESLTLRHLSRCGFTLGNLRLFTVRMKSEHDIMKARHEKQSCFSNDDALFLTLLLREKAVATFKRDTIQ